MQLKKTCVLLVGVLPLITYGKTIEVSVLSNQSEPVADAVVVVESRTGTYSQTTKQNAIMDQVDKQFVPHVLVVQSNTEVAFPNSDSIKHHVYSFSPAKQFELRLYQAFDAEPILFDQAGLVEIGCNIHDWMVGYIYVTDSPYFGKTDDSGKVSIEISEGEYIVTVWHPGASLDDVDRRHPIPAGGSSMVVKLKDDIVEGLDFASGFGDYE